MAATGTISGKVSAGPSDVEPSPLHSDSDMEQKMTIKEVLAFKPTSRLNEAIRNEPARAPARGRLYVQKKHLHNKLAAGSGAVTRACLCCSLFRKIRLVVFPLLTDRE
ncbi:hypothetical protein EVAR_23036_1 [Eumeta japonica]|uniref:Uncharacterized protein n=1 Tax=Eumeta variegata TaxID=151549 RepID=A0A4C1UQ32_EUMVA|nr:hypothetical protein EVAR_23036_1 [Eumeta japonica]